MPIQSSVSSFKDKGKEKERERGEKRGKEKKKGKAGQALWFRNCLVGGRDIQSDHELF